MTREFDPHRLDVRAFAEAGAVLSGDDSLRAYARLDAETALPAIDSRVRWKAVGARRGGAAAEPAPWLHLSAQACVPLTCQRCLTPVELDLQVDRRFRFAADEQTAAAEDEDSDEDVLAASHDFDLHALIEDELLMEIPITPRHEICPEPPRFSMEDADFSASEEERPNPFAVLGALRSRKPDDPNGQ